VVQDRTLFLRSERGRGGGLPRPGFRGYSVEGIVCVPHPREEMILCCCDWVIAERSASCLLSYFNASGIQLESGQPGIFAVPFGLDLSSGYLLINFLDTVIFKHCWFVRRMHPVLPPSVCLALFRLVRLLTTCLKIKGKILKAHLEYPT
jgi:hypothetical protein